MKVQPIQGPSASSSTSTSHPKVHLIHQRTSLASACPKKPFQNTIEIVLTILYYISFIWLLDAIIYRNHETYTHAKLAGLCLTFAKAKEYTKRETILNYIVSIKNGSYETRFMVDPKKEKDVFPKLDNWLQTLSKRQRYNLSNFSLTVYALPIDSRWTSYTKDRRNLAIVELAKLHREKGDFFATITSGDFDFIAEHAKTEESTCKIRGDEREETYNLRELMKPLT